VKRPKDRHRAQRKKRKASAGTGKRSLYSPDLGSANWRKAQDGRFAFHPVFRACRQFQGAYIAIHRMTSDLKNVKSIAQTTTQIALRLDAVERQMEKALCTFCAEAEKLKGPSEKLRFAEAIREAFNESKRSDEEVLRVCRREIEMRTLRKNPSQAELRHAVEKLDNIKFSTEKWKRLLKRTGLNKRLPTQREKRQGITLRKV